MNVHFSIGIGHSQSHVKERNFLPLWQPRALRRARDATTTMALAVFVAAASYAGSLPSMAAVPDRNMRA
eukprot:COSAG02_NODE_21710_length_777_cov_15.188791_1_plen_68_part_10